MTLPALALHSTGEHLDRARDCWTDSDPLAALRALAAADANLSVLLAVAAQDAFAAGHSLDAVQHAARPATDPATPTTPTPVQDAHHVPVEACVALCEAEDVLTAVAQVWGRSGPVAALDVLLGVVDQVEAAAGHAITAAAQLPTS